MRFGLGIFGFALSDQLNRSADRLALAYVYGPTALGYFQNAFLVYSNLISLFFEPLHNVAVSGLSKLRGDVVDCAGSGLPPCPPSPSSPFQSSRPWRSRARIS